jgi:hypothetical protein
MAMIVAVNPGIAHALIGALRKRRIKHAVSPRVDAD